MPAGWLWAFRAVGVAIVALGVYLSGGEELTCAGSPAAECRLRTHRWLGKSVVGEARFGGVTNADTIVVPQTGVGGENAWYLGLFAGDREVGRVFARREQAQAARSQLAAWFEGGSRGEAQVFWSTWPFGCAAMVFGLVWLAALTVISRAGR